MNKVKKVCEGCVKSLKKVNKNVILMVLLLVVVVFCSLGMIGLGSYKYGWDNKVVNAVIRVIPFPAATINGRVVTLYDFHQEVDGVVKFAKESGANVTKAQINADVIDKLIFQTAMEKLAREYDVVVTDEDLDNAIQSQIEQLESQEAFEENIEKFFGWDTETFKNRIIYIEVLRNKLIEAEIPKQIGKKEAEEVLKKVQKGKQSFEELVAEYSDDPGSLDDGGDLGFFGEGVMVEPFETAAFALNVGEVSGLVETDFGYHIIKVEEKRAEGETEQVRARHILIGVGDDFAVFFDEYKNGLKIRNYVD
jgi:parvulin-like peptidyl-prolyl isomerase